LGFVLSKCGLSKISNQQKGRVPNGSLQIYDDLISILEDDFAGAAGKTP
jgi:hypothetical protein